AELDRFQTFLDLIDRAHQEEIALTEFSVGRSRALAISILLEALEQFKVLEEADSLGPQMGSFLGTAQVEQVRLLVYEKLLLLANDLWTTSKEHGTNRPISPEESPRQALRYLNKAMSIHPPTQAFYRMRAYYRAVLGDNAAAQADEEWAAKTRPKIAADHLL